MAFLLISMYQLGLKKSRSTDSEIRDLLLNAVMLLVSFFVVIAFNFVAIEVARGFYFFSPRALLYAVPVAGGAMLICIFHGIVTAASFSLIASVLACAVVDGRVEFFIYFFVSSLLAATWVRRYRERGVFIEAGLKVGLCNMILAFAMEGLHGAFFNIETVIACCSAFIGGRTGRCDCHGVDAADRNVLRLHNGYQADGTGKSRSAPDKGAHGSSPRDLSPTL